MRRARHAIHAAILVCASAFAFAVTSNASAQCRTDKDCHAGRTCKKGHCVGLKCAKDADCPNDEVCEGSVCKAPEAAAPAPAQVEVAPAPPPVVQQVAPLPPPPAPPPPPMVPASGDGGWGKGAAIAGFTTGGVALVLGLASEATKSKQIPSIPLGATYTVLVAAMTPVVAVGGSSARRGTSERGIPALRITGWITYGLTLFGALVLIGEGVSAKEPPTGVITTTALVGTYSIMAFSVDALVSSNRVQSAGAAHVGGDAPKGGWGISLVPVPEGNGRFGGAAGVVGTF